MTGFIYVITNDLNGKQYVGKTTDSLEKRFDGHCKDYARTHCEHRPLYYAMNKYGIEHFHISLLEECDLNILPEKEQEWIDKLDTYKNGYNATLGGDGKQLYDYDIFVQNYDNGMTAQEIADKYHCDSKTIRIALNKAGRDTKKNANSRNICIAVQQVDKNTGEILRSFNSAGEAARYMQEHNYTKDKRDQSVGHHIIEVAMGKRKTAYGFKWKLKE